MALEIASWNQKLQQFMFRFHGRSQVCSDQTRLHSVSESWSSTPSNIEMLLKKPRLDITITIAEGKALCTWTMTANFPSVKFINLFGMFYKTNAERLLETGTWLVHRKAMVERLQAIANKRYVEGWGTAFEVEIPSLVARIQCMARSQSRSLGPGMC